MEKFISECCGEEFDEDYRICPNCLEHCEPDDDQIYNDFCHEGGIAYTPKIDIP